MEPDESPNRKPFSFEEAVGAAVAALGAGFVVASLALAAGTLHGCGACWPGSCPGEPSPSGPTPAPTPENTPSPMPSPDCSIGRNSERVVPGMWQSRADSCPRLQLDETNFEYDDESLCEMGLFLDGAEGIYTVRYRCNSHSPWAFAPLMPKMKTVDGTDVQVQEVRKVCPPELLVIDSFIKAEDLEPLLWEGSSTQVKQVASQWEEGCRASDVSEPRRKACVEVCAGGLSLLQALKGQEIEITEEVSCYLKLYDQTMPAHAGEMTVANKDEMYTLKSACQCMPTSGFLDCVTGDQANEACLMETTYDEDPCGKICFLDNPTVSTDCRWP